MSAFLLKWGKNEYQVQVDPDAGPRALMKSVEELTNVPVANQKLMSKKGGWKGVLDGNTPLKASKFKPGKTILTLMGSAESTVRATAEAGASVVKFEEDITPEEASKIAAAEAAAALKDESVEGMIAAVQMMPSQRDDGKAITYRYNYFVTGLPQRRIESLLKAQREMDNDVKLTGVEIMTFGNEVSQSFVLALAVLDDGTLISGYDNGKIHMWKEGRRIQEIVHGPSGPVNCIVSVAGHSRIKFATGGGLGSIILWDGLGNMLQTRSCTSGTTPSEIVQIPASASDGDTCLRLAIRLRQAVPFDANEFRLVPQDSAQQARRDEAIAERERQSRMFAQIESRVHILTIYENNQSSLSLAYGNGVHPVTSLTVTKEKVLCAADSAGTLRQWKVSQVSRTMEPCSPPITFTVGDGLAAIPICLEGLSARGLVAASLGGVSRAAITSLAGQRAVVIPPGHEQCIAITDIEKCYVRCILTGHTDVVRSLCSTPDGALVSVGGKKDATVKVWSEQFWDRTNSNNEEMNNSTLPDIILEPTTILKEPGYCFDLQVLPDMKAGSSLFALAGARYNVVKVVL